MDSWYKATTPRKEVREGRSFNPDEFAIALEQVVAGTAPADYRDPKQFFSRTCFTRALREHAGMVLRRLAGQTANTAPVLTLITQFGGGKTHTLTALYHLTKNRGASARLPGVSDLLKGARLKSIPEARVTVFVGNAWDPQEGIETPWIDIARQLAGNKGVKELGAAAKKIPPGTDALTRVFQAANAPVLLLFDEVLNFLNRHRDMADQFHAFIQNLTVATMGTTHGAAVISLPRSQIEMTDWDMQWQDKITKVVRRVAKDLIANDETEIAEVVRRRLFENLGSERKRRSISKAYSDWCFERRGHLPPEWTAVDTTTTESKARDFLRGRFETCYPFHPATLSVFQRKWQALPHYQQTRGTLAMLAQWIAVAYKEGFTKARREPLITLGSAPLEVPDFRSVVLGQLAEPRLVAAIDADIAGEHSHARALDADTKGPLRDIHRRVATAILFESSGGQIDKVAHTPELYFALGEPNVDTTSIEVAANTLQDKAYFIRKVGRDGFSISHQPTLKKVVYDRRASLDEDSEIKPAMRKLIEEEFKRGSGVPLVPFPEDGADVQDTPKLTLVVVDPDQEWPGKRALRTQIAEWTKKRGQSPRLHPGALVWCFKKQGRDLRDKVEIGLAWKRVQREISEGTLGGDFERDELAGIRSQVSTAEEAAKDEVWGGYRYAVIADSKDPSGLKTIDLGAGHSSGGQTMCGRVIAAMKSDGQLNENVGAGYIERHWPRALKESGAWPLSSLRQAFLDGSLTRLLDPDRILRARIVESVGKGEFGLASNLKADGSYERVWFNERVGVEEVDFKSDVFLLLEKKARSLKAAPQLVVEPEPVPGPEPETAPESGLESERESTPEAGTRTFRIYGDVPPEVWNRLGTRILPKLRSGSDVKTGIQFSVTVDGQLAQSFETEIRQILDDLGLTGRVRVE